MEHSSVLQLPVVASLDDEIVTEVGHRTDRRVHRADVGQIDVTLDVERSAVSRDVGQIDVDLA